MLFQCGRVVLEMNHRNRQWHGAVSFRAHDIAREDGVGGGSQFQGHLGAVLECR